MAGYIKLDVEKLPTHAINTQINTEIFTEFQRKCKLRNLQMCTVIEVFMAQYTKGKYEFNNDNIDKWKGYNGETSTLNTPVNKEIYLKFKDVVKSNGLFVKQVLHAFVEEFGKEDLIMEFVKE